MKSSTLPQYTSNPSLNNKTKKQQTNHEESTYSFPNKANRLHHAKSHGELYQTNTSLALSPVKKANNNENELKYSSESPQPISLSKTRTSNVTQQSHKIPLWKRFKKMIVPSKRNKERQSSASKIPTLLFDELRENEPSKNFSMLTFLHFEIVRKFKGIALRKVTLHLEPVANQRMLFFLRLSRRLGLFS